MARSSRNSDRLLLMYIEAPIPPPAPPLSPPSPPPNLQAKQEVGERGDLSHWTATALILWSVDLVLRCDEMPMGGGGVIDSKRSFPVFPTGRFSAA